MPTTDELTASQEERAQAWRDMLLRRLEGNRVREMPGEADPGAMRVHIEATGQTIDFVVRCVDSREIAIELSVAESDNQSRQSADERKDVMQGLVRDYFRHLQQRAQVLHDLTHPSEEK